MNKKRTDYGNWVPEKMLWTLLALGLILLGAAVVFGIFGMTAAAAVCVVFSAASAGFLIYMYICHELFAFGKGNMMARVHEHLVEHLDWDGEGTLLDIGCGSAALTVRCAKAFPNARVTGMDYWGAQWNYAKEQCEENAKIEGTGERCRFERGDAANLSYPDESFDAAVSNFVFHEVRTAKDKRAVVREALRIVKKGGAFAFQDLFDKRALYGDIDKLILSLKDEGISEVHYIGALENKLGFPRYAKTPWMISGVGIIYGRK